MTEAEVRKEFAEDDEQRIADGEELVHATSPSAFIFLGLELEEMQYVTLFSYPAYLFKWYVGAGFSLSCYIYI